MMKSLLKRHPPLDCRFLYLRLHDSQLKLKYTRFRQRWCNRFLEFSQLPEVVHQYVRSKSFVVDTTGLTPQQSSVINMQFQAFERELLLVIVSPIKLLLKTSIILALISLSIVLCTVTHRAMTTIFVKSNITTMLTY